MTQTFARPADVLPGWMISPQCALLPQVGPVDGPIVGAQQPARKNSARCVLKGHAALHGKESPVNPAADLFARHANQPASSSLTADLEKRNLEFSFNHAPSVPNTSSKMKQELKLPKRPKEVDQFIWQQIEDELTRRRLNIGWLWRKLGSSRQVVNGWKMGRGVPTGRYEEIAELFGWSLERLTTGQEPAAANRAAPEPQAVSTQPAAAPAPGYSPMALDLAGMFDAIPDDRKKRQVYAMMVQMLVMSAQPSHDASGLVAAQTPAHQRPR